MLLQLYVFNRKHSPFVQTLLSQNLLYILEKCGGRRLHYSLDRSSAFIISSSRLNSSSMPFIAISIVIIRYLWGRTKIKEHSPASFMEGALCLQNSSLLYGHYVSLHRNIISASFIFLYLLYHILRQKSKYLANFYLIDFFNKKWYNIYRK